MFGEILLKTMNFPKKHQMIIIELYNIHIFLYNNKVMAGVRYSEYHSVLSDKTCILQSN